MEKYEEVKCIGRGSYGSAHLVTERATGSRYVIKKIPMELLSESEKQQSFREVELLAKLKHPNVVEYKESFVDANVIHIVMAYCDGGDLAGRIKERASIVANGGLGYFDTRQILDWFVQMAMAIKYLHEQRILHRDLKTSNIFLTTTNVIKLGDFGIAKTLDSTLDQAKTVVGTPYYMSPEVCESKPYSYASDVWSLGCVLYEMVALRHAFDAPNILTLILKIVQNDFAAVPPHYDSEISEILRRLLDKRPENRPTMDQIFLMPYIRNHMQALVESGGSLKMNVVSRRPHGTPKRRAAQPKASTTHRDAGGTRSRRASVTNRWASIAPNDREDVVLGEGSDLELLDASGAMEDDSNTDLRLPERSRTPEPLVAAVGGPSEELVPTSIPASIGYDPAKHRTRPSPQRRRQAPDSVAAAASKTPLPTPPSSHSAWTDHRGQASAPPLTTTTTTTTRRPSVDDVVEEELDTRFQAEALMSPNFQRVYAEECDDSLTVKYASPQFKSGRAMRRPPVNRGVLGRPPKPQRSRAWTSHTPAVTVATVRPPSSPLSLSLDEPTLDESEGTTTLSDSGMLRQLELEEASSTDGDNDEDGYSSTSDAGGGGYDGEENFYSEQSEYSDDSDFGGDNEDDDEDDDAEYSDDFEDVDGEVIEYANDEFADEPLLLPPLPASLGKEQLLSPPRLLDLKSPKLASSPAARRAPREVQWVMRNVAQSLLESCENLSVA